MCGIVGAAGWLGREEEKAVKDMLVMDTLRGEHSTGIAVLSPKKEAHVVEVVKLAVNAIDFLKWGPARTALTYTNSMVIGHNRYATKGAVNNVNAHPFDFDNVVGVHNGTLLTRNGLTDTNLFEVDSENLYYNLDKSSLGELYPKLDGAIALSYFDKRDGTLNLIRNEKRPLLYTYSEDRKTLFWASEAWMLAGALTRNSIKYTEIIRCEEHTHYSFVVPKAFTKAAAVPFDNIKVRKLEPYKKAAPPKNGVLTTLGRPKPSTEAGGYLKYQGKEVEFYVNGIETRHGTSYVSCSILDDEDKEVRVFCNLGSSLAQELDKSFDIYSGRVLRVAAYGVEPYIAVDSHTVKNTGRDLSEILEDDEEDDGTYLGPKGNKVGKAEAEESLKCGCAWCDEVESVNNIGKVKWFGIGNQYICSDCVENPDVNQYLAH